MNGSDCDFDFGIQPSQHPSSLNSNNNNDNGCIIPDTELSVLITIFKSTLIYDPLQWVDKSMESCCSWLVYFQTIIENALPDEKDKLVARLNNLVKEDTNATTLNITFTQDILSKILHSWFDIWMNGNIYRSNRDTISLVMSHYCMSCYKLFNNSASNNGGSDINDLTPTIYKRISMKLKPYLELLNNYDAMYSINNKLIDNINRNQNISTKPLFTPQQTFKIDNNVNGNLEKQSIAMLIINTSLYSDLQSKTINNYKEYYSSTHIIEHQCKILKELVTNVAHHSVFLWILYLLSNPSLIVNTDKQPPCPLDTYQPLLKSITPQVLKQIDNKERVALNINGDGQLLLGCCISDQSFFEYHQQTLFTILEHFLFKSAQFGMSEALIARISSLRSNPYHPNIRESVSKRCNDIDIKYQSDKSLCKNIKLLTLFQTLQMGLTNNQ